MQQHAVEQIVAEQAVDVLGQADTSCAAASTLGAAEELWSRLSTFLGIWGEATEFRS